MTKASDEVNLLWPYLLPKIQRVVSSGGGSGSSGGVGVGGAPSPHDLFSAHHTGTLDDSQAPQFLLMDGTRALTGHLSVNAGITIDGVDLSAHVADPNAHHDTATVGNTGLSISGQQLSLNLATSSGLAISSGVKVDRAAAFAWTGIHSWTQDLQVDADLDFIGAQQITTSAGNLTLNPFSELILPSTKTDRSSDYADGIPIAGYSLHINSGGFRQLTTHTIKADELHVRVFIADTVRVDVGEEYWGKSMGIVYADFTTPASIGGTVTVTFEDSVALTGAIFANTDWIMISTVDIGTGLEVNQIWGQVSTYTDLGADVNGIGRQSWVFTLRSGTTSWPVKKGRLAVDFGVSGQGYVHLSTLQSADGPWIQIGTWAGANPYTAGNRTIRTQIGNLINISDPDFTPTGYGLYSENAYLHGVVRTVQTIMDDDGLTIEYGTASSSTDPGGNALISWWPDVDDKTSGFPTARVAAWQDIGNPGTFIDVISVEARKGATSVGSIVNLDAVDVATGGSSILIDSRAVIAVRTGTLQMQAHIIPQAGYDVTFDLGSASLRWRNLYVNQIFVSGAISGATLSGQTWSYPGSMVIDAKLATDTVVSVANSLAGRVDLAVDRDITLGGNIDGVDLSAHVADANAHHNQAHVLATGTALGGDHTISGAAAGEVLRALSATTAAFDVLQHGDLGGITANQHHNQSHVLATGTALGADHTISGAAAGEVLRALSATTAAFDVLQHDDLGGVTADQHHNQSHVLATGTALGGDHTISGASAGEVLRALSATTAAFDVLQHADLGGVTADQHHNQVHGIVSSDHTGTGAALSVVGFSAVNTLGVLVPSSDVSAGVAALLKSTPAGGLGLASMFTTGAVDVGQGLTAGNNTVRMIYHTSGTPHTHMVINPTGLWSLDEQFGLDIDDNLLVRGWIVGKHAIQVADARMLAHYDGPTPIETNFVGDPTGHMGQVGTLNGGAIFRGGKFGKAIQTGEATTNLITNPSFETGTTGWTTAGPTPVLAQRSSPVTTGGFSIWFSSTAGTSDELRSPTFSFTSGTSYTFSFDVKASSGAQTADWVARFATGGVGQANFVIFQATGEWQRVSASLVAPSTGTYYLSIYNRVSTFSRIYIDSVQVEAKAYATPYCDGSLGNGHAWTGTAHASTSTRTAGHVAYSDPAFDDMQAPLTVMAWIKPSNLGAFQAIISKANAANTLGWELTNSTGTLRATLRNATVNVTAGALVADVWQFAAFTYDGADLNLYLNGTLTGTAAGSSDLAGTDAVLVGRRASGNNSNGFVDEVSLIDRALTADEIRAIYESGAPIFAETSTFQWRAGRNRIYADSEGLWGLGASGATILGLYAGDDTDPAATKSWGGLSLSEGDFLLGRYGAADGGWLYFNQDLVGGDPGLTFGYAAAEVIRFDSGGASLTGVLDIDSTGGIYQGSGSFASPTTGLKVWNTSGIGRIAGYNTSVAQWYADTDGKLYAGGGNVLLDASGIAVAITSASAGAANSYNFNSSGVRTAYISGQDAASVRQINMTLLSAASKDSGIYLDVQAPAAKSAYINLQSVVNSVSSGVLRVGRLLGSEPTQVEVTKNLHVNQSSTTLAQPTLQLTQSDLSEEFIAFVATSGAGDPIQTAALGAYQGKVRISINGSFFFVPYYL